MRTEVIQLGFGLRIEDLYNNAFLPKLDALFLMELEASEPTLAQRLLEVRSNPSALDRRQSSDLILEIVPYFEDFIGNLFLISREIGEVQARHTGLAPIYAVKRKFVQRHKAVVTITAAQAAEFDAASLAADMAKALGEPLNEMSFARKVQQWMTDEVAHAEALAVAGRYAAWALLTPQGRAKHKSGVLFKKPHNLEPMHLVPVESLTQHSVNRFALPEHEWRHRDGFKLTDTGTDLTGALDEAYYCIHCHNQQRDSCSFGFKEKDGSFRKSLFGTNLAGCPLEEKISEFHTSMIRGFAVGALGIITIDNPFCAGTGHRICNDCMKACVFQKQEPVNIPEAESFTLREVLNLPWGFEIYSLLTRWNPLNFHRPYPKAPTGYKVLVVGLGPAGYTLAHHLINDGHTVVAIDGLKIEPLEPRLSGVDAHGRKTTFRTVKRIEDIFEALDERRMAGFGGVAEYGITVRWNKNFLKVIRLLLERRNEFALFGGVRFGGAITVESAMEMGFDHIALCMGAGAPTVIDVKNGLARGVRQASDFLMALQLQGAARKDTIANLQLRLPVVVIGGGLTAIDTATESMAYYVVQVKKFLARYEKLVAAQGAETVRGLWNDEEKQIADEFIAHARALHAEDALAKQENRPPRHAKLIQEWGGVTVAYRRRLVDSPSYTLNHEEVTKALEEGIQFAECLVPEEIFVDDFQHASAIRLGKYRYDDATGKMVAVGESAMLPARSILVAAGTQPNTVAEREDPAHFQLDGKYFQAYDENGNKVSPKRISKPDENHVLCTLRPNGKAVSFFGDLHPSFQGNVVKAMGGAKRGYPTVSNILKKAPASAVSGADLIEYLNQNLRATVHSVHRLAPTIVEVQVRAPLAARAFRPGQFYRLQNFETYSHKVDGTVLSMEGLALTGASVDHENGLLSTIVLEMGGSSNLCAYLKKGEPIVLMGPTGAPTETPRNETVLLAGGGLGNAVLFSIGAALRKNGSRVIYFAAYKKVVDRYKVAEIEAAADQIVWCCDEAPGFTPTRPQDRAFVGNILQAMKAYGEGTLYNGVVPIPLKEVDRIVAIGSDMMMKAVAQARHGVLAPLLNPNHVGVGSINSPMQCMMKEVCAQCLQTHRDPQTGKETTVFSCYNQDQPLDHVDFKVLRDRLSQNSVQEKLTRLWLQRCLAKLPPPMVGESHWDAVDQHY
jgi:NADPH-dependent glutamate synthase beta subunit-like oxidoreductase/NAD(P)H-flavin reductase